MRWFCQYAAGASTTYSPIKHQKEGREYRTHKRKDFQCHSCLLYHVLRLIPSASQGFTSPKVLRGFTPAALRLSISRRYFSSFEMIVLSLFSSSAVIEKTSISVWFFGVYKGGYSRPRYSTVFPSRSSQAFLYTVDKSLS